MEMKVRTQSGSGTGGRLMYRQERLSRALGWGICIVGARYINMTDLAWRVPHFSPEGESVGASTARAALRGQQAAREQDCLGGKS